MNNLLELKGAFDQANGKGGGSRPALPKGKSVSVRRLQSLLEDLCELREYWIGQNLLPGVLVSVYYNKVAAKSNRLQGLLGKGSQAPGGSIVGARFSEEGSPKHIITHYVSLEILEESISRLQVSICIFQDIYGGKIDHDVLEAVDEDVVNFQLYSIAKTNFLKVVVDAYYVDRFGVLADEACFNESAIISLYKTDVGTPTLLARLGIYVFPDRILDDTTVLLNPDEIEIIKVEAPYLVSMAVNNLTELSHEDFSFTNRELITIPPPTHEPTIGVIDTLFDDQVYFSEWVTYKKMISDDIPTTQQDTYHGTAVASLLVDGPSFNPHLDDGCGRFRVRHFGVATRSRFNSFSVLRNIQEIIAKNRDIKVWNLSLGSMLEVQRNFISPEAAILDKIQTEYDVVFVVAGTNMPVDQETTRFIGAPADSINSLVVNAVTRDKRPASYSRKGPVLSFFIKPDIAYYGGDRGEGLRVCTATGEAYVGGTSYAAPWIARKIAYLIHVIGLSREAAKALLIHSATEWDKQQDGFSLMGYGVVPVKIDEVLGSSEDEIQFILQGVSEKFDTYTYNIPVPIVKGKHPFIAKATLCYFSVCSRNQGVDYTNTELDITFGRLKEDSIKSINNNFQTTEGEHFTWEADARKLFRKWDNVKHIREVFTGRQRGKTAREKGLWGLSLKTKERLEEKCGEGLKFAVVISLREINGINRVQEFVRAAQLKGWLVRQVEVESRVEIFSIAEEELELS